LIWIIVPAVGVLVAATWVAWWGSNIVFHPPKMLKMEIWPDKYQLVFDPVEFRTSDGLTLKGWLIPAASATDKTLLLLHGWGDNKGDLLQRVHPLAKDFNLFLFDFRQHGESQGTLSTIGCLESRDVEAALEFLKATRPAWTADLGAFGLSMGAAVAIWAAGRHPEIKAVAVESPYSSFNRVVTQWLKNEMSLPYFPFAWLTLLAVRLRVGTDPEPYSPERHAARVSPRPFFVIAGEMDRLMPLNIVREVYDAAREPKELWVVPGATHGKCEEAAGSEYSGRLAEFFRRHLG